MLDQCGGAVVWLQEPDAEEDIGSQLLRNCGVPVSTVGAGKVKEKNATKLKSLESDKKTVDNGGYNVKSQLSYGTSPMCFGEPYMGPVP